MDLAATVQEIDWYAFGAAIANPPLPRLDEACAVAGEVARGQLPRGRRRRLDPLRAADAMSSPDAMRDVTESVSTRLDLGDLLEDDSRRFLPFASLPKVHWTAEREHPPPHLSDAPLSAEMVVALAAAAPGAVRRAEEAAREAARRLRPWGFAPASHVAWALLGDRNFRAYASDWSSAFDAAAAAALLAAPDAGDAVVEALEAEHERHMRNEAGRVGWIGLDASWRREIATFMRLPSPPIRPESAMGAEGRRKAVNCAARDAWSWWNWQFLVAADVRTTGGSERPTIYPASLRDTSFRHIPNPLDPLMAIYALGYVPIDLRGGVFMLGAPANFGPVSAPDWDTLWRSQERFAVSW